MKKRILFTGGAGKAGRHAVPYLVAAGYEVHNIDLTPLESPGVTNLVADITDSGQMFNVMSMHRDFTDLEHGQGPQPFDAVVHFAAVPRILIKPDNETFRINTMGTYNVIEAAVKSGIRKIIVASSETTYGVCFAEGHRDFHQFPLDEDYDVNPMDSYGLSKVVNEKTARAFAERSGADIYALRIGNVIEPHEYENFPAYFRQSGNPQAHCLELYRCPRFGPDRQALHREGWAGLPGLQCGQRHRVGQHAVKGTGGPLFP